MKSLDYSLTQRVVFMAACTLFFIIAFLFSSCHSKPCLNCSVLTDAVQEKCGSLQDNIIDDQWIVRFSDSTVSREALPHYRVKLPCGNDTITLDSFNKIWPPQLLTNPSSGYTLIGNDQDLLDSLNVNWFRGTDPTVPANLVHGDVVLLRSCGCNMATFYVNPTKVDINNTITQSTSKAREQSDGSPGAIVSVDVNRRMTFGPTEDNRPPVDTDLSCLLVGEGDQIDSLFCDSTVVNIGTAVSMDSLVNVAIIDSGVDFMHTWMGGGQLVWVNRPEIPVSKYPNLGGYKGTGEWSNFMEPTFNRNCYDVDFLGYDFFKDDNVPSDRQGHGTHVGGIVSQAYIPMQSKIRLMPLKVGGYIDTGYDEEFTVDLFSVLCAMDYAIEQGASVINMSLGYYAENVNLQMEQLTQKALEEDVLIVASTGNDNMNIDCCQHWPSNLAAVDTFPHVVSVAALDRIHKGNNYKMVWQLAPFSNYGDNALIAAPGVDISGAEVGTNGVVTKSGTSMAAAVISQQAAILRRIDRTASAADIRNLLLSNAHSKQRSALCVKEGWYYDYCGHPEILDLLPQQ